MSRVELVVEAAFGLTWQDAPSPSQWVPLSRPDGRTRAKEASWSIGRDDEFEHFPAGTASIVLWDRDRALDPDNAASPYAGQLLPLTPVRIRAKGEGIGLRLASAGQEAAVADTAAIDVTGDLDVRVHVTADDWTPGGFGGCLASKWAGGGQQSWFFGVSTTGALVLNVSSTGANQLAATSTAVLGFENGTPHWVRATIDVNDGGGNRVVRFYTSPDGTTWTQLGATVTTAGTISIFNSTASLVVGDTDSGGLPMAGWYHRVEVRTPIGGSAVADASFDQQASEPSSFTDTAGRSWTLAGGASWGAPADQFYGYVVSGWERVLSPKGAGDCHVELVDLLGVIGGRRLPDYFDSIVLGTNPVAYWVLDGTDEEVADRVGVNDGLLTGSVQTGAMPVLPGDRPSVEFSPGNEYTAEAGEEVTPARVHVTRSPLVASPTNVTWMATFRARRGAHTSTNARVLVAHTNGNGLGAPPATRLATYAYLTPQNRLRYVYVVGGVATIREHPAAIIGPGHIFFGQSGGIAVDSSTLVTTSGALVQLHPIGVNIGGGPGVAAVQHWDGWIGAAAIWSSALGPVDRFNIFDASRRFAGDDASSAIIWPLNTLGVPAALQRVDTGTVVLPPVLTGDEDALELMRAVTATEGGQLYVDHRDRGRVRWTNRYHRFLSARSTAVQATFSDDPAAANVIRYSPDGLEVAPNGLDGIVNEVTATWRDGEVVERDTASIDAYGPRSRQIDTIGPKALALSAAKWLVRRYKDPRSRVRGVTASRRTMRGRDDRVMDLRVDDLVSFRLHPLQVGAASTTSLYVDGITHRCAGPLWETSFRFAQADTFDPWIWGTGQWGSTTTWG